MTTNRMQRLERLEQAAGADDDDRRVAVIIKLEGETTEQAVERMGVDLSKASSVIILPHNNRDPILPFPLNPRKV